MGLYNKLETWAQKKEFRSYEERLPEIKRCIEMYKEKLQEEPTEQINQKVSYCLENGIKGLEYYFKDLLESGLLDEEDRKLFSDVETLSKNINYIKNNQKKIQLILKCMGEDINQDPLTSLSKITDAYDKNIEAFNSNGFVKAAALLLLYKKVPSYNKVYKSIEAELKKEKSNGKNVLAVLAEMFEENKIDINLSITMKYFKDISKQMSNLNIGLVKNMPKYVKLNKFLMESRALKESIQSKIKEGYDKDLVLDEYLPSAFALASLAYTEKNGMTPYDIQLIAGMSLNKGEVSEIKTGEGKTLIAFLPAYLNALSGDRVDVITTNDYLAQRDYEKNKSAFELLGMSVGLSKTEDQDINEKKKVYSSNIVYSSINAIAFDYLKDTYAKSEDEMVMSSPLSYAIVDEADLILLSMSPFILSSSNEIQTNRQEKENERAKVLMQRALKIEKFLSSKAYVTSLKEEFDYYVGQKDDDVLKSNNIVVLKGNAAKSEIYLTEEGEKALFCYAMFDEMGDLLTARKEFISQCPDYVQGVDYMISPKGRYYFSPDGLDKAVKDSRMPEFAKLNEKWLSSEEELSVRKYVMNALRARHSFEKGKDYDVITNSETGEKEVVVLKDGRILANSRYTDGLHEAIELKEGITTSLNEDVNILDSSVASISVRALMYRYPRFSCMTGTSAKSVSDVIFDKPTFTVPRNANYKYYKDPQNNPEPIGVSVEPTAVYISDDKKIEAIVEEVRKSNEIGQPVLVVTNNSEEAKKIFALVNKLKLSQKPNLLIAEKSLEEEANIISNAGSVGAVTIATEMAGRGTDIKVEYREEMDALEEVILTEAAGRWISLNHPELGRRGVNDVLKLIKANPDKFEEVIDDIIEMYNSNDEYRDILDADARELERKRARGLKCIQAEPFLTSLNDKQVEGRVGRQGEPGEYRVFASFNDLDKLGVDVDIQKKIYKAAKDKGYVTDLEMDGKIDDAISDAQAVNEYAIGMQLASSDGMDLATSAIISSIINDRKQVIQTKDLSVPFDNMVYSTIDSILKDNVPPKKKKRIDKPRARLTRTHIDYDGLTEQIHNIFGVDITEEEILGQCINTSDIKFLIKDRVDEKFKSDNMGINPNKVNDNIRGVMVEKLNEAYEVFIDSVTTVNLQQMNDYLAQNFQHDRTLEINDIFEECKKDCWYSSMKSLFRPGVKEKTDTESKTK